MSRRAERMIGVALAAIAAACHESPSAPVAPPGALATVTLDTITFDSNAEAGMWQGLSVILGPDAGTYVLALDAWNGRMRLHVCASSCGDPRSWLAATLDSGVAPLYRPTGQAVATPNGIDAVYDGAAGMRFLHCPGACSRPASWAAGNPFPGHRTLGGASWAGRRTPLAADRSGALHLLFADMDDSSLHYARCTSGCTASAGWQDVPIASGYDWSHHALSIAVAPSGAVHAVFGGGSRLEHATCAADCTSAPGWSAERLPGDSGQWAVASVALAYGADGTLHLAYIRFGDWRVRYATCAAPCVPPGRWSEAALPLTAYDLSLSVDGRGQLMLATAARTVTLSSCGGGCLDPASWRTTASDSAWGNGLTALAVDAAGRARVVSSYGGFPAVLQYSESP